MTATVQEMAAEMIVAGGVSHGALEDDALQEYHITVPPGIRAGQRFCARVDTTLVEITCPLEGGTGSVLSVRVPKPHPVASSAAASGAACVAGRSAPGVPPRAREQSHDPAGHSAPEPPLHAPTPSESNAEGLSRARWLVRCLL